MKYVAALAVLAIVLAWYFWPGFTVPTFETGHANAAIPHEPEEDVDDDPTLAARPPAFDPWADPPPIDPRKPRLPDPEDQRPSLADTGYMLAQIKHELKAAVLPCYLKLEPAPTEIVTVNVTLRSDSDAGHPAYGLEGAPPAAEACMRAALAEASLPALDDVVAFDPDLADRKQLTFRFKLQPGVN
jgi:hypothetical protein